MSDDRRKQARLRKLSRFLSLVLRHRPARFPIPLDDEGYTDLDKILRMLNGLPNFRWAKRADVEAVLALPGRQRFEIVASVEGDRIRALYGHTAVRPSYPEVEPPDVLYHGTASENLDAIDREGLRPMARQYVHLAMDVATARSIALRHTDAPVILHVDALTAREAGIVFYHPVEAIYLCEVMPPEYVERHES